MKNCEIRSMTYIIYGNELGKVREGQNGDCLTPEEGVQLMQGQR